MKYFRHPHPLPAIGEGFEHATLDLKMEVDWNKRAHLAKDVAAFANHLGGTLIIGAQEEKSRVKIYKPLSEDETNKIQKAFSEEVEQRCSPRPIIDFSRYAMSAGFILAVLVYPSLGSPIGVKVKCNEGGYSGNAYIFPVRSGSITGYLFPEQLPMYMLAEIRRISILLEPIAENRIVFVHEMMATGHGVPPVSGTPQGRYFKKLDTLANILVLEDRPPKTSPVEFSIPIDGIRSVWQSDGNYHIAIKGQIHRQGPDRPGGSPPAPVFLWRIA